MRGRRLHRRIWTGSIPRSDEIFAESRRDRDHIAEMIGEAGQGEIIGIEYGARETKPRKKALG
jgi:hypothetical protein